MHSVRFACLLVVAGVLIPACGPDAEIEFRTLGCPIIGGQEDTKPEHQAVVVVYDTANGYMCTGTLIAPRIVLTAAHCLTGTGMQVGFGNDANAAAWRSVQERQPHPQYSSSRLVNDIAVLRFGGSPPAGVVPIPPLPRSMEITDADLGQPLEFVGFGATASSGSGAGRKRTMTNNLSWICTSSWCGWDNPGQTNTICQDQTPGGICSGDSGGPAFIIRQGREYVAGVTSYSGDNCLYFGCSTKVDEFESFWGDFLGAGLGEYCSENLECASGFCVDGVCCENACSQKCQACNLSGYAGSCRMVSNGTDCSDSNVCNGRETCQSGECQAGTPLTCDEPGPCLSAGCDPAAGCFSELMADGAPCPDSVLCDGTEVCLGGICIEGAPLDCEDQNPCTQNFCDPLAGCQQESRPDGFPCSDSGDMACVSGECIDVPGEESNGCGCGQVPGRSDQFFRLLLLGILIVFLRRR
jgi:hypothetical protein